MKGAKLLGHYGTKVNLPLPTGEVDFVVEFTKPTKSGEGTIFKVINGTKSNCHAELVSASVRGEILKRVQGDNVFVQGNNPCVIASVAKQSQHELTSNRLLRRFTPRNDVRVIKKCAFTLSEVLIVLAVLGVVAAMTIPDLIQDYKEKATVTAVKRVYSVLNQAVDMSVADNGPVETWDWGTYWKGQSAENVFREYLKPYLRIDKDCGKSNGCWHRGYMKNLQGQDYDAFYGNPAYSKVFLSDGTSLALNTFGSCNYVIGTPIALKHVCGIFYVDINGASNSNTRGKDIFAFYITSQGVIPCGTKADGLYSLPKYCNINSTTDNNGYGCTAWVIKNENMDYLRKTVSW